MLEVASDGIAQDMGSEPKTARYRVLAKRVRRTIRRAIDVEDEAVRRVRT